ncbi:FhaA domain-containing protein [Desulfitobacterium sp.]|uniref:FhaA domain-containing protein n=1 Tax=Desulfitobacterium sp. TaxID=49981 RepID=UPI002B1EB254|nr:FhaA domain-containing protein [Desulfitobacterium sp.]MEA4900129.1 FhaA domain-containing protein [Desulfitobacterium sp.]
MSLLARFEEVAEHLFTGVFKKNAARLQPVEIAKELVKAMYKNKQVSISQVYVPNVYRVYLHSSDWSPLASFGEAFLLELSKYIYAEGQRSGFTFLSKPSIELHADDTVKPCEMFVEVDFDDSIEVKWDADEEYEESDDDENNPSEAWRDQTNILQGADLLALKDPLEQGRKSPYYLEVLEGSDQGKRFPLKDDVIYIGRHSQCEIVLNDAEVSRRHLRICRMGSGWEIDDLGSTNGTWLNSQRISKQILVPGDRIEIGQTIMALRRE